MYLLFILKPGKPAIDVMLTILAVVVASATLQASGGLDVVLQIAERISRRNPVFKRKTSLARLSYEILSALLNEAGVRTRDIFLL